MKVALLQENPTVGDLTGNVERLVESLRAAAADGAELAVCTELAVTAYPPRDLLDHPDFVSANLAALEALARRCPLPALVGFVDRIETRGGTRLCNAAALLNGGVVEEVVHKTLLPTYDVFDEARYFHPTSARKLVRISGIPVGVTICEDVWNDGDFWPERRYDVDPVQELVDLGARLLVNLSASPFTRGKRALRQDMLAAQARKHGVPLIVVNQVGGHDDLLFDGGSLIFDRSGTICCRASDFERDLVIADVNVQTGAASGPKRAHHPFDDRGEIAAMTDALVLGIRDYSRRCGFTTAILGLSGGIDSAVTAALAARALGPDKVYGVALPSRYSSSHSLADAEALAEAAGVRFQVLPIEDTVAALEKTLATSFAGKRPDITEENLQARARGILLMALSNKFGHLLLNTGNKSEIAVGYCTLYGDMCGGLSVISDLYKGEVYAVARELNALRNVIPDSTMTKPPSAELKPGQLDQDTLPPYEVLDEILVRHIEHHDGREALVERGFDAALVDRVLRMVARAEYKRYQLAPGLKVRPKSFGPGRRMPLAATVPWR